MVAFELDSHSRGARQLIGSLSADEGLRGRKVTAAVNLCYVNLAQKLPPIRDAT